MNNVEKYFLDGILFLGVCAKVSLHLKLKTNFDEENVKIFLESSKQIVIETLMKSFFNILTITAAFPEIFSKALANKYLKSF